MKKFESLEEQEQSLKKDEEIKVKHVKERNSNSSSLRIVIYASLAAVMLLGVLCFVLFKPRKSVEKPKDNNSKKYTIEVEGKQYSANSISELSEMVGFDVSFMFNNQGTKGGSDTSADTDSVMEAKIYKLGEKASVETNMGNYKFGITEAKLYRRNNNIGGDVLYRIYFDVENENVNDLIFRPDELRVSDANDTMCSMVRETYDGECAGLYDSIPKGKKSKIDVLFHIADFPTDTLQINYPQKGIIFEVEIDNIEEMSDMYGEREAEIGEMIHVTDGNSEMEITINDIRIDNSYSSNSSMKMLVIECDVNNISYDPYNNGEGFVGSYLWSQMMQITDEDDYTITDGRFISGYGEGNYSSGDSVKPGSKKHLVLPYLVSDTAKTVTIDFGNGTILTHELD